MATKAVAIILLLLVSAAPALAFKEIEVQRMYCADLPMNVHLEDGSEVDCTKGDLAVEVDFSDHWAQAIGQSLHYAQVQESRPAIMLVCNENVREETCERHLSRMLDTLSYWRIGMFVWFCNPQHDRDLDQCRFIDLYEDPGMQ